MELRLVGSCTTCVERYCELAHKNTEKLHKLSTSCLVDHQLKNEELEAVKELSEVRSQLVFKFLYLTRIGNDGTC